MLVGLQDADDLEKVEEDLHDVEVDRYRCKDIPAEHRASQRGLTGAGTAGSFRVGSRTCTARGQRARRGH
jgi:hypothetical protein